jgi:hypothetical protein
MKAKCFTITLFALAIIVGGVLSSQTFAESPGAAPNASNQSNLVTVEGTATIYGHWSCKGQADIKAVPGEALEPVPGFPGGVQTTKVNVSVKGIECGDGTMNKHMMKALKEKENPEIHFQTSKYELEQNGGEVKALGELTIAGVTKPIELDANLTPLPQGGVRVTGKVDIQMKDFDVKPPSLMFGALKVANEVTVKFDSVLQPSVQQASATAKAQ